MTPNNLERKVREKVVYRNGQVLTDIPSYVREYFRNTTEEGQVTISVIMRRASREFEEGLVNLLDVLSLDYTIMTSSIMPYMPYHASTTVKHNRRSLVGSLHFDLGRFYEIDGLMLESIIKYLDALRSLKDKNKRTTIMMRIESYLVKNETNSI